MVVKTKVILYLVPVLCSLVLSVGIYKLFSKMGLTRFPASAAHGEAPALPGKASAGPVSLDGAAGAVPRDETAPEGPEISLAGVFGSPAGKTDLILEAYRNFPTRDMAVDFFGRLVGDRELGALSLELAAARDIAPALVFALVWEESRWKVHAVNRKNRNGTIDRGLFQLNSASFPGLKEADFFNPRVNISHGLAHLRWCFDYGGSEVSALAMYNAGCNRVNAGGTPRITLDYISRILKNQQRIEALFEENLRRQVLVQVKKEEEEEAPTPKMRLTLLSPLGRR
jgi:hypothetical protein